MVKPKKKRKSGYRDPKGIRRFFVNPIIGGFVGNGVFIEGSFIGAVNKAKKKWPDMDGAFIHSPDKSDIEIEVKGKS